MLPLPLRAVFGTSALRGVCVLDLQTRLAGAGRTCRRAGDPIARAGSRRHAWPGYQWALWSPPSSGWSPGSFSIYASTFGNRQDLRVFAGIGAAVLALHYHHVRDLLGAEINAESEQQTIEDTTKGEEEPLGERGERCKAIRFRAGIPRRRSRNADMVVRP